MVSETPIQTPAPRVPVQLQVEFRKSYARKGENGTLKNISLSGAFLDTDTNGLDSNDKVVIEFKLSGRSRKISAHVVWKNSTGVGLKFNHFNNRDVQIVDDLIYFVESSRDKRRSLIDSIFKRVG